MCGETDPGKGAEDMLKGVGCCMIFCGCLGLGIWYRNQLTGRVRALHSLRDILELLAGEVRYGRDTLPECCRHIAKYLPSPFEEAFLGIGSKMEDNTGITFEEAFREGVDSILAELPLKPGDRDDFLNFTRQTGFADSQMQLRAIEQGMEQLGATERKLEKENDEKCRMAVGLGVMGGLLLVLVLC